MRRASSSAGLRGILAGLLALASGCRGDIDYSKIPKPPPAREQDPLGREEERREVDPQTGRLEHEWSVFVTPGRGSLKHGTERIYFPNGKLHWEREYRYGKPTGAWRSFYENGQERTECFYLGPDVPRTMTFWREDGKVSAQGPAVDGSRRGTWRFYWANGRLAEEGEYKEGMREGTWMGWSREGKRRFERIYKKNVRVSQREMSGDDPAPAAEAEPPPSDAEPSPSDTKPPPSDTKTSPVPPPQ